jgi:hypothetical protein
MIESLREAPEGLRARRLTIFAVGRGAADEKKAGVLALKRQIFAYLYAIALLGAQGQRPREEGSSAGLFVVQYFVTCFLGRPRISPAAPHGGAAPFSPFLFFWTLFLDCFVLFLLFRAFNLLKEPL